MHNLLLNITGQNTFAPRIQKLTSFRRQPLSRHLFTIVFIPAIVLYSCQKQTKAVVQPKEPPAVQSQELIPFVPPADSLITLQQIKAWSLSNTYLDSLAFRYADSFKTNDPTHRIRYQEDFIAAQNQICVRAGLRGGYAEYTWIIKNSGNPKNKPILDSAHAQVH
jgi:hypothetical protein